MRACGDVGVSRSGRACLAYRLAFGVDINATHHRPVTAGWVTGVATALRLGRTVASYDVVLIDDGESPDLHGSGDLPDRVGP